MLPHFQTSTHGQETILNQLTLMLIIQEQAMTSQPIASTRLLDTAVSPHPNKLLNQQFTDHNQLVDMLQSIQSTT